MAMSKQATKYVGAIQLGTSAALTGYRVIQSVLFLANALPIRDKNDLRVYIEDLMEVVEQARDQSQAAQSAFKEVRADIFQVCAPSLEVRFGMYVDFAKLQDLITSSQAELESGSRTRTSFSCSHCSLLDFSLSYKFTTAVPSIALKL